MTVTAAERHWIFTGWRGPILAIAAAIMALYGTISLLDEMRQASVFGAEWSAYRGFRSTDDPAHPGWRRVHSVLPGSAGEAIGLVPGDLIHHDHYWMSFRNDWPNQRVAVTIDHAGTLRHTQMVSRSFFATYEDSGFQLSKVISLLSGLIALLLGTLVVWRGWGRLSALLLGALLLGGVSSARIPLGIDSEGLAVASVTMITLSIWVQAIGVLMPYALYCEIAGRPAGRWGRLHAVYGLSVGILVICFGLSLFDKSPIGSPVEVLQFISLATLLYAAYWSWRGLRNGGLDSDRFRVILLAYVLTLSGFTVTAVMDLAFGRDVPRLADPIVLGGYIISSVYPFLLAWAVLRNKAIDLGFAINRTLVYGVFSAILLVGFGLLEWAAHHLLPEEWAKASAWIDGGIAVGLYLVFHRIKDYVEHRVEHLFFRSWQENEARLRRFVTAAAHFEGRDALAAAFAAELARFTTAPAGLYLLHDDRYIHSTSGWHDAPQSLAIDDPALALLRAERTPLELDEIETAIPGRLALPMLDHGALLGVAIIGEKADSTRYRTDEIEVLGWAAQQIGLDLAALRARELQSENARLSAQLEKLTEILTPKPALA